MPAVSLPNRQPRPLARRSRRDMAPAEVLFAGSIGSGKLSVAKEEAGGSMRSGEDDNEPDLLKLSPVGEVLRRGHTPQPQPQPKPQPQPQPQPSHLSPVNTHPLFLWASRRGAAPCTRPQPTARHRTPPHAHRTPITLPPHAYRTPLSLHTPRAVRAPGAAPCNRGGLGRALSRPTLGASRGLTLTLTLTLT